MSKSSSDKSAWSDLFLSSAMAGSFGALAAGLFLQKDKLGPMTKDKLLAAFDEQTYFANKATRLERQALEVWARQLDLVSSGESIPAELDLRALDLHLKMRDAKADADRKLEKLNNNKAIFLAQILDERRKGIAEASALRMLATSLRKCGSLTEEAPSDEASIEAALVSRGKTESQAREAMSNVAFSVETVLRSAAVPEEGWVLFEEIFPTIEAQELKESSKYERSLQILDEALVRAVRPPWREGAYPDKPPRGDASKPSVIEESIAPRDLWIDPKEVALILVSAMGTDNGVVYSPSEKLLLELTGAVETMMSSGLRFSSEICDELVAGELGELEQKYGSYDGYKKLNAALDAIFDGPISIYPGMGND